MSRNVMEITWEELEKMDKKKTVMFITLAPIEQHGRHLPLGVDVYESKYWEQETLKLLENKYTDYEFLVMPPVTFGYGSMSGFPGNLYLKQTTIKAVAYEIIENIVNWGINNIVIISGHADPKHLIAIEEACEEINTKYGVCAFSPMGAIFSSKEKGLSINNHPKIKEIYNKFSNDFHAGWIETSNMLDIENSLVKSNYLKQPDVDINPQDMIYPEKISRKIEKFGHIGYPKIAKAELGKLLNEEMVQILFEAVNAFIKRDNYQLYEHHFLYNNPYLRTNKNEGVK